MTHDRQTGLSSWPAWRYWAWPDRPSSIPRDSEWASAGQHSSDLGDPRTVSDSFEIMFMTDKPATPSVFTFWRFTKDTADCVLFLPLFITMFPNMVCILLLWKVFLKFKVWDVFHLTSPRFLHHHSVSFMIRPIRGYLWPHDITQTPFISQAGVWVCWADWAVILPLWGLKTRTDSCFSPHTSPFSLHYCTTTTFLKKSSVLA